MLRDKLILCVSVILRYLHVKYSVSSFLTRGTLQKLLLLSSEMKIALRRPLHVGANWGIWFALENTFKGQEKKKNTLISILERC